MKQVIKKAVKTVRKIKAKAEAALDNRVHCANCNGTGLVGQGMSGRTCADCEGHGKK